MRKANREERADFDLFGGEQSGRCAMLAYVYGSSWFAKCVDTIYDEKAQILDST